jgi:hypothetical protein
LPGSAARIIAQNFASCRLACSFKVTFFLVFNPTTSLLPELTWVEMGCGTYHIYTKMEEKVNKMKPAFRRENGSIQILHQPNFPLEMRQ